MKTPIIPARTVAFSGYRPAKLRQSAGSDILTTLPNRLHRAILRLAQNGFDTFLCGMAEGFDLLAARAVLEAKKTFPALRLAAVVPFPEQARAFSPHWKAEYDRMLTEADESVLIASAYHRGCYHRRNDFLVANASVLVCYYDGLSGGTKYTFEKASRRGLRILNLALPDPPETAFPSFSENTR